MADEKTEQPTDKRLRDARKNGEVPKSQEVASAFIIVAVFLYFIVMSESIFKDLSALVEAVFHYALTLHYDEALRRLGALTLLDCSSDSAYCNCSSFSC